jgi:hypothetical protein
MGMASKEISEPNCPVHTEICAGSQVEDRDDLKEKIHRGVVKEVVYPQRNPNTDFAFVLKLDPAPDPIIDEQTPLGYFRGTEAEVVKKQVAIQMHGGLFFEEDQAAAPSMAVLPPVQSFPLIPVGSPKMIPNPKPLFCAWADEQISPPASKIKATYLDILAPQLLFNYYCLGRTRILCLSNTSFQIFGNLSHPGYCLISLHLEYIRTYLGANLSAGTKFGIYSYFHIFYLLILTAFFCDVTPLCTFTPRFQFQYARYSGFVNRN